MGVSADDFRFISELVLNETGIVLGPGKEYLVETRLYPLVKDEQCGDIAEFIERLRTRSLNAAAVVRRLIDAFTTNETSFFRDIEPFEALKRVIVPALLQRRQSMKELNIWSAASSSGQEAYSIAMLLLEEFPQLRDWKVSILGTDISRQILERAQEGRYSQFEVNRGLPVKYLVKYFTKDGNDWFIRDEVKRMVRFQELNLVRHSAFPGPKDIVFMRNVLIYFDLETKRRVLEKVRRVIAPDGCLFLGAAETTLNIDDEFKREVFQSASFYRLKSCEGCVWSS